MQAQPNCDALTVPSMRIPPLNLAQVVGDEAMFTEWKGEMEEMAGASADQGRAL